jgi:DNA polymerase III delta prime subunit
MHSIRQRLVKRRPELSYVLFWSAAVLPYVDFPVVSNEWHDWQVLDAAALGRDSLAVCAENVLRHARSFLSTCPSARWFRPDMPRMDESAAADIAHILRPSFEIFESRRSRQGRWTDEVRRYTEEQFVALDAMETNPRVLFTGPAGTGKTILALECARREVAKGNRCLLLCYTRLLGRWLQEQTASLGERITTSTFHSLLLSLCGSQAPEPTPGREFWEEELPELTIEALIEREPAFRPFDTLIIDEAQDLIRPKYLELMDLLLRGGVSLGRWRLFGDLEKQAIFTTGLSKPEELLEARSGNFPLFSLRVNCRNAPRIASLVRLLGGLTPDYSRVLRPDNGIEPELKFFKTSAEHEQLLTGILESWYGEGIRGGEISVLSPRADKACLAAQITKEPWRSRLRPYVDATAGHVPYASIHAFKGLEASAVLVTDVESLSSTTAADLFYVAVTRALHRLTILVSERARAEVIAALTGLEAVSASRA